MTLLPASPVYTRERARRGGLARARKLSMAQQIDQGKLGYSRGLAKLTPEQRRENARKGAETTNRNRRERNARMWKPLCG